MAEIGPKHVRNTCETVSTKGKQAQARAWAAIIGFRTAMVAFSLPFELNASFPDRCMPFRTAMAALAYILVVISGPLHAVRDRNEWL